MIEQARELGLALANPPEFLRMAKARQNMTENTALCELMTAFNDKRDAVVALMQSDDIDRVEALEMSADLERLQQQLFENPIFTEVMESERVFQELLNAVNDEIRACIGLDGHAGCSGDCSGCKGCSH